MYFCSVFWRIIAIFEETQLGNAISPWFFEIIFKRGFWHSLRVLKYKCPVFLRKRTKRSLASHCCQSMLVLWMAICSRNVWKKNWKPSSLYISILFIDFLIQNDKYWFSRTFLWFLFFLVYQIEQANRQWLDSNFLW